MVPLKRIRLRGSACPASADPDVLALPCSAVPAVTGMAGLVGLLAAALTVWKWELRGTAAVALTLAAVALPMWWIERRRLNLGTGERMRAGTALPLRLRGLLVASVPWLLCLAMFQAFYPAAVASFVDALVWLWPAVALYLGVQLAVPTAGDTLDVLGRWLRRPTASPPWNTLRNLSVKAFFLPLMLAFLTSWWNGIASAASSPLFWFTLPLAAMYLVDVAFAGVGYLGSPRATGAHIRSSNPYPDAWIAALICYPPFFGWFSAVGVDYHSGLDWAFHFPSASWVTYLWGAGILGLTGVYASATVVFGPRFSNLTNRGIVTHGPYRWLRHPAYVSKNLTWWMMALPFMPVFGWRQALYHSLALLTVNAIYWTRAVTEERHLLADAAYRRYFRFTLKHGLGAGFFRGRWMIRSKRTATGLLRRYPLAVPATLALCTLLARPGEPATQEARLLTTLRQHEISAAAMLASDQTHRAARLASAIEAAGMAPIALNEAFPVASLSKPLTALITLELAERGVFTLDDPVVQWLPDFLPGEVRRDALRLRHLLSHRSGFTFQALRDPLFPHGDMRGPTCQEAVKAIEGLAMAPGGTSRYMNVNYCVLQSVLEAATGRRYIELVGARHPELASVAESSRNGDTFCRQVARLEAVGGLCLPPALLWPVLAEGVLRRGDSIRAPLLPTESEGYGLGWRVWRRDDGRHLFSHFGYVQGHFSLIVADEEGRYVGLLLRGSIRDPSALFADLRPIVFGLLATAKAAPLTPAGS